MSNKIDELCKKARGSGVFGAVSIVFGIIGLVLSYGYSQEADRTIEAERAANPEYQALLKARDEQDRIEREKYTGFSTGCCVLTIDGKSYQTHSCNFVIITDISKGENNNADN